ncbi:DsbA family protein [Candidatus Micrarchaeota archaeon]|nr:DsbA family protein [Candidatus Micrarchaeota archaeon]
MTEHESTHASHAHPSSHPRSDSGSKALYVLAVSVVVSSLILSFAFISASGTLAKGLSAIQISGGGSAALAPAAPQPTALPAADVATVLGSFAAGRGKSDAKVTVVEFSDYQCPFCRKSFNEVIPSLFKDYVDAGKVRFIFKDFPLSFHPNAPVYAEAARCAGDQGNYFEMHDKIFAEQDKLGPGTVDVPFDKKWAEELGLNAATFNECFDSGKYTQAVQQDFADGVKVGVSGTPTFFVNGLAIVGAQPYAVITQAIDAELSG